MDGMEDEEGVGNVGSEHEREQRMRGDGNCDDIKAETDNRNGEQSKTDEDE
jgi:hypothetical protein